MSSATVLPATAARRWTMVALTGCAVWLLLQNALLLAWFSSQHLGPALVVLRALTRVGLHLAAELWMLPVAVLLGVALALSSGSQGRTGEDVREVSHV